MKCPKCGIEQPGTVKCDSCGLIFEKYRRYQEMLEQGKIPGSSAEPSAGSGGGWFRWAAILMVACAALLGFWYFRGEKAPAERSLPSQAESAAPSQEPETAPTGMPESYSSRDFIAQLEREAPPANMIEKARNATVFLQTPWGQGAGFFIDEKCSIVTNRHVVKLSDENITEVESRIRKAKVEAESLKAMIQSNKEVYEKVKKGEARLSDPRIRLEDMEQQLRDDEERLGKFMNEIEVSEQKLNQTRWSSDLSIVLADGTKLVGLIDYTSDKQDLALVRPLGDARCPAIPVGASDRLSQGDKLYTVGSPMGIRHTVTSGIFSGSLKIGEFTMLQTDAPINPGNSGGPLIDQSGRVVGINTMVLNKAEGIGFAIPIEQAIEFLPVARN